ncbi:hypothetical protein ACP3V3_02135 [Vibrio sp. PNB22_3_1]
MKKIVLLAASLAVAGCVTLQGSDVEFGPDILVPVDYVNLLDDVTVTYPAVATDFLRIHSGSQVLLTANTLADKLGVEFVEWNYALNPYEFSHQRNLLVDLHYKDPQRSFIKLFRGTGLLPYYDSDLNTVHVYPYELGTRIANVPTIFTPMFEHAQRRVVESMQSEREREAQLGDWFKYFSYDGYSIRETVNAWAHHAGMSSVVWFIRDPQRRSFIDADLVMDDFYVGATPLDAMKELVSSELIRRQRNFDLTLTFEPENNRLIVHPYRPEETIQSFEILPTSVRHNLIRLADYYGYELEYLATDYRVLTGYVSVVGDYLGTAIDAVSDGYPIHVEVVESTKQIKVRDK